MPGCKNNARMIATLVVVALGPTTGCAQSASTRQSPSPAPAASVTPPTIDAMAATIQLGAKHGARMFAVGAAQMSEADYAFRPTAEVRTFGQLVAHVADENYGFCAIALGEKRPVTGIEKSRTTRTEILQALEESMQYCDKAFAGMSDSLQRGVERKLRGQPMPALAVLNFRNYHMMLHWGNAITYMRLRGKVPPST